MKIHFNMIFLVIFSLACTCMTKNTRHDSHPQVLVIKAAGYIEGQTPQGPEAITEATSFGRNVHVVSQALVDELKKQNINAIIVQFNESSQLQNFIQHGVDLIVFAGPAYSGQLPRQLQELASGLNDDILKKHIICTSLTTCRFLESGGRTIQAFDKQLKEMGIHTIDGLVIHHEYEDKDWETKVQLFADRIRKSI
jgi:predicted aldo/keto reductase-like oxidoreductase